MEKRCETVQQRKARLQTNIETLRRRLMPLRTEHNNMITKQLQERCALEDNISSLEEEIELLKERVKPVFRARAATRPERCDWAKEFCTEVVQPRKWTPLEIKHFIVGICKYQKCNVSIQDIMDCYYASHKEHKSCQTYDLKGFLLRRPTGST